MLRWSLMHTEVCNGLRLLDLNDRLAEVYAFFGGGDAGLFAEPWDCHAC